MSSVLNTLNRRIGYTFFLSMEEVDIPGGVTINPSTRQLSSNRNGH